MIEERKNAMALVYGTPGKKAPDGRTRAAADFNKMDYEMQFLKVQERMNKKSRVSHLVRPLRVLGSRVFRLFYHPQRFYPIQFGPLRGLEIRFGAHVNIQQLLGFWERKNFAAIIRLQDAGFLACAHPVMYDVGANVGLYSLLFSSLVGPQGRVFALEPGDVSRAHMIDNLQHNKVGNVLVEDLAFSDMTGTADFYVPINYHSSSSLRAERAKRPNTELQTVRVRTTTLDDHWAKAAVAGERVVLVKIDIEGAADSVLPHCQSVALSQRPFFLIESHSLNEDTAIGAMMQNFGYCGYRTTNNRWVVKLDAVHLDPDGVWGTLLLVPKEHETAARAALGR
ncbi:MAG TPA: FkbM family methyltransferase [Terriglobales bacterium]|nr:FkbM family methyltransferase [Terriglobales bacterium]